MQPTGSKGRARALELYGLLRLKFTAQDQGRIPGPQGS